MLAVDTNVIVRYLTRDDPEQFARASALIRSEDVFICTTVLLECEWVLRGAYRYSRDRIAEALRALGSLPRVTLEDQARAFTALSWFANGMDFADALHLAGTEHCAAFVSFDRSLIRRARQYARMPVRPA
jgi:predicted nucleic-acid-binding protein